jgi:hypothetical protein
MNEPLENLPADCGRALSLLPALADDEISTGDREWLDDHSRLCPACATAAARFAAIDGELARAARTFEDRNPAPPDARQRLIDALPRANRRWPLYWPAAAALVAGFAVAILLSRSKPTPPLPDRPFVAIPYLPPVDPRENTTVVRVNIRVQTLLALGYRTSADPTTVVPADVLLGEDGRAHAIRPLSAIEVRAIGD